MDGFFDFFRLLMLHCYSILDTSILRFDTVYISLLDVMLGNAVFVIIVDSMYNIIQYRRGSNV